MATAATDTRPEPRRFTGDEVMRMVEVGILGEDEKAELLDGTLWIVTPQGFDHGDVITGLNMTLARTCPPGVLVRPQCPLVAGEYSLPEPDFAVLSQQAMDDGRAIRRHPKAADTFLLIEIVDTRRRDALRKSPIYAAAGAPRYWIVDIPKRHVDVLTEPRPDGSWGGSLRMTDDDALELPWSDTTVAVRDVLPPLRTG